MEVSLRQHVDNLGERGQIVKVADGYARNYLLPRKLALPATEGNKKHVERERKIMETREAEERGQAEAIAARLLAIDLTITRRVGVRSGFGSGKNPSENAAFHRREISLESSRCCT